MRIQRAPSTFDKAGVTMRGGTSAAMRFSRGTCSTPFAATTDTGDQPFSVVTAVTSEWVCLSGDAQPAKSTGQAASPSEWVARNPAKVRHFAGRWIAVTAKGVGADAETFDEVFALADQRGIPNPLVFKVPMVPIGPQAVSARHQ